MAGVFWFYSAVSGWCYEYGVLTLGVVASTPVGMVGLWIWHGIAWQRSLGSGLVDSDRLGLFERYEGAVVSSRSTLAILIREHVVILRCGDLSRLPRLCEDEGVDILKPLSARLHARPCRTSLQRQKSLFKDCLFT